MKIHHTAICTRDLEGSLRFWRDGLGLVEQMNGTFEGDWPTLFGASDSSLHSIFLGDPADPTGGFIELVEFPSDVGEEGALASEPRIGFFLVSMFVDLDATLARLRALGITNTVGPVDVEPSSRIMVAFDPNGVRVELINAEQADILSGWLSSQKN